MNLRIPQEIENIIKKFKSANYELYLIGGAVRDHIMGAPITDWDFTTDATPEQILSLFNEDEAYYNNTFGTVGIKSEQFKPHEITTFRSESSYSDNRRPDKVEWGNSIQEDLKRRDFTMNAIALRLTASKSDTDEIIDPFGGQKDIDKKIIKAVGDPYARFAEDALRMMRAVRFGAQLNFKIEKKTLNAIQNHAPSINKIAAERIHDELIKILASAHPYEGILLLRETRLSEQILPELEKCFGVEQKSPERHHIDDVGTHLLKTLKHCPNHDPIVRFAALIHDIGKPQTFQIRDGVITFYNHEVVGARIAKNIAKRLKFSKADTEKLFRLVRWHQFSVDHEQTDTAIKRFIRNVGAENVDDMLDLRTGDRVGSGARETSWRTEAFKKRIVEVQKEPFTVHDLKITGNDIMQELNIKPGPKVGQIMKDLFEKVENKEIENEREVLLSKLQEIS